MKIRVEKSNFDFSAYFISGVSLFLFAFDVFVLVKKKKLLYRK